MNSSMSDLERQPYNDSGYPGLKSKYAQSKSSEYQLFKIQDGQTEQQQNSFENQSTAKLAVGSRDLKMNFS